MSEQEQPRTTPLSPLEEYYEAMHMMRHVKPGSPEYQYWFKKAESLFWATELHNQH